MRERRASQIDRDDELLAAITHDRLNDDQAGIGRNIADGPLTISSEALMGKMPKADRIIKKGILWKLSSTHEWKPMDVALTTAGLFMARPDEEQLRDLIPLYEIRDVKKKADDPNLYTTSRRLDSVGSSSDDNHAQRIGTLRNMRMTALIDTASEVVESEHFIIQVRTIEDGYNSGRTYFFDARSIELCNEWLHLLRKESDHAVVLMQAGPSHFQKLRFRLRRFYRSVFVQSTVAFLIFLCFIINILQTEMAGSGNSSDSSDAAFAALEYFFTIAFMLELLVNMAAHFIRPFFQVLIIALCFGVGISFQMEEFPATKTFDLAAALLLTHAFTPAHPNHSVVISTILHF
jgi:hypothetical protein